MKLIDMSVRTMGDTLSEDNLLKLIGQIAGECYNSSMDDDRCINRALNIIKRGHHSPWEHYNVTLRCTIDRGTSHALVRHRHCAFQQSSTIYQNFKELEIIEQPDISDKEKYFYEICEQQYTKLMKEHNNPSRARDILPNALATNLIITTNIRQWMYMLQRRCGPGDSENMHGWCALTRLIFEDMYPRVVKAFDEWYKSHPL